MRRILFLLFLVGGIHSAYGQVLTLDSCRALALRNNKSLGIAKLRQDMAVYATKAARTKYLPKIDAVGGYEYTSREISLLNNTQKSTLGSIGTNIASQLGGEIGTTITGLTQQGIFTPEQATHLSEMFNKVGTSMGSALDKSGQHIVDAFRTDTRNLFVGSVMLRQPVYMGGAITAANRIARISEDLACNSTEVTTQATLYEIDQTYWLVVSLKQKQKLANSFLELVQKLDDDIHKMIDEGVATRADGLRVDVKVNEAEMAVTQADNGLSLSKMLLCQLCGLPLDTDITLADEGNEDLALPATVEVPNVETAIGSRPELKVLQNVIDISHQSTRLIRAAYLPQVALTGGYLITNPNLYDGFQRKFGGAWNVGVIVRIPVWNWMEGEYKVKASKIATSIATMELTDAQEKIELQLNQSSFKVSESQRRLTMARKNVENANENLRCANLGFREGVLQSTEVMEAQTAWLQAQTQKIDAEIDLMMSQVNLRKALGTLQ